MEKERSSFPEERIFLLCTGAEPEMVLVFHQGRNPEYICGVALQLPSGTSLQAQFLHWNDEIPLSSYGIVTKWIH